MRLQFELLERRTMLTGIVNGDFAISDSGDPQFGWSIAGDAAVVGEQAVLTEDPSVFTRLSQTFVIEDEPAELQFTIVDLNFGTEGTIPDAFEVTLLDAGTGESLVATATGLGDTDSLLNIQSTGEVFFGPDTSVPGASTSGEVVNLATPLVVTVDMNDVAADTEAALTFRLLGFSPFDSSLTLDDVLLTDAPPNNPPVADAGGPYAISEGEALALDATGSMDLDDDDLTFAWEINGDASFDDATGATPTLTWADLQSLGIDDDGSFTVTVRVDDGREGQDEASVGLTIDNVAPTIALAGDTETPEGSQYTLTLGAVTDPGNDTVTEYIVDWGDGSSDTFGAGGDVTHTYDDGPDSPTIFVDLIDEDGTHTDAGSLAITVQNVAPTATLSNDGPVDEGSTATVSFSDQFDPSTADTTAGFTYSYDFDNDGTFEITDSSIASAVVPASFLPEGPGSHTVGARIADKDGGFTDHTTTIIVGNVAPTADLSNNGPVDEGSTAIVSFSNQFDPSEEDTAAGFTYSYDFDNDGTFEISGTSSDSAIVPASFLDDGDGSRTVRARIEDQNGAFTDLTTTITINNVAPTADLSNNGPVDEGSTAVVSFGNQFDPSTADTTADFTYSYDFDNDGTFEISDVSSDSAIVPASFLDEGPDTHTVGARIADKDGGFTDLTTTIVVVNVAPTADLSNNGPVDEGSTATVAFSNQFDPSEEDTAAGFAYSYDFDNDGTFEISGTSSDSATVPASFLDDGDGNRTVRARIEDQDGAFTDLTTTITINNVAPTADVSNDGPVDEGSTATVSFSNQFDPSEEDTAAGFAYSYDFDNDGTFEISGTSSDSATVPASFLDDGDGSRTVRARIEDQDGAFTDLTTTITINNVAPTADLSNDGPVDTGSTATVSFSNQSDPSTADTTAGFTYSYDFDNDGTFEITDSSADSAIVPASFLPEGPDTHTVGARIVDKDDGFTDHTTTITITQENDPPVVDLNGAAAGLDFAATFTQGGGAVTVVDAALAVTDSNDTDLVSATAAITNLMDTGQETLSVDTSGTDVNADYDPNTGVLSLTGTDSLANYQQVLRTLSYDNSSTTPSLEQRIIDVSVNDGEDDSETASSIVTITQALNSLSGFVYADVNHNGVTEPFEMGLPGVTVMLSGPIQQTVVTNSEGRYLFEELPVGVYEVQQVQPDAFNDGIDTQGDPLLGSVANNRFFDIDLSGDVDATGYNFGERGLRASFVSKDLLLASTPSVAELVQRFTSGNDDGSPDDDGMDTSNTFSVSENATEGVVVGRVTTEGEIEDPKVYEIEDPDLPDQLKLAADDHFEGAEEGEALLIEYLSLECPSCANIHPVVEDLVSEFDEDLLVVRRHQPLTDIFDDAFSAALAAEAAGRQGEFDEMVDVLFERLGEWSAAPDPQALFDEFAADLGLDVSQFNADMNDPALSDRINRDIADADILGVNSTPAFFLNGDQITAPGTFDAFAAVIDEELATFTDTFTINRRTGDIEVAKNALLDFETRPTHQLTVIVVGLEGIMESVDVTINVLDQPEAN